MPAWGAVQWTWFCHRACAWWGPDVTCMPKRYGELQGSESAGNVLGAGAALSPGVTCQGGQASGLLPVPRMGLSSAQTCGLLPILSLWLAGFPLALPCHGGSGLMNTRTTQWLTRTLPLPFCHHLTSWGPSGAGNGFLR